MRSSEALIAVGTVTGTNRDVWTVELANGRQVRAYPSGKLRKHRIRIIVGDRVRCELSPYQLDRGRIVYRWTG